MEAGKGGQDGPERASQTSGESEPGAKSEDTPHEGVPRIWSPWSRNPREEQVYGDATPLIVEWRRVSTEFLDAKDRLSKAIAGERMKELEIERIGEHRPLFRQ